MLLDLLESIAAFLKHPAGIALSITAILSLIPKVRDVVLSPIRGWWRGIQERRNDLILRDRKLDDILHQVLPNTGTSIPDKLTTLAGNVETLVKQGDENLALTSRLQGQVLALMDLNTTPMFALDEMGLCTWVNRAWCEMVGMRSDDALKSGWQRAIHPADKESVMGEWRLSMMEGRTFQMAFRYRHMGTNQDINAICQTRPQLDRAGRIIGHLGAVKIVSISPVLVDRRSQREE